ncbi:FAD-dependent oxidoreductase [Halorarius litoreus]|uniref:FAD-dependent oxidoreductase n=1 Tax=Halorarius litoreus TaxID=2962676 RepID=UPI0020CF29AF|nr:FAD-dependent oxidoreductase [Halorarius litoreus]
MDEFHRRTVAGSASEVCDVSEVAWDVETDVVVAGGGGSGLTAALAASQATDLTITVLEKEPEPGGNTKLSTGLIPAAGTRLQAAVGVEDSPEALATDVLEGCDHEADEAVVRRLAEEMPRVIHWLMDDWDVPCIYVEDFKYPSQSEARMHSVEGQHGANVVAELLERVQSVPNIELLTNTPVRKLVAADGAVVGVVAGEEAEAIRSDAVVLATDGFGANKRMLDEWCGAIKDAPHYGAEGNTGDGIRFGAELGGELGCMDSYQAHATLAEVGAVSPYALVLYGGIIVNGDGERFGNEGLGPADFAVHVVEQPATYEIFDERIYEKTDAAGFGDFDEAVALGAYTKANTVEELAAELGCDPEGAARSVRAYNEAIAADEPDEVGRDEYRHTLEPPFYGTKTKAVLMQTQGGLVVDTDARVLRTDGSAVDGLYAAGGSAMGLSGTGPSGYLPGNGLMAAFGLGRIAGLSARERAAGR